VYHDFLSDPEVETVKRLATPRFKRATVQNYKTGELETASYRYFSMPYTYPPSPHPRMFSPI
jgi:hypothetical protein